MAFNLKLGKLIPKKRRDTPIKPKIRYLISAAGVPNYGDEFITRAWLRTLAQLEPDSEVWLDCINPAHAVHLFSGDHPNLRCTATAWGIAWWANSHFATLDEKVEHACKWMREYGSPREDAGIYKIKEANSIHLLGGGYLNENWDFHLLLAEVARSAKELEGIRVFGTGLGIAPCSDEWLAKLKDAISVFDSFEVRDEESAKLLGIDCGLDDAFLGITDPAESWQLPVDNAKAFVCLQEDVVGRRPEAVEAVVNALISSGVPSDSRIVLVEAIPPDDGWALDSLKSLWKGEVATLPFLHMWNNGFPVAEDAIWVSSRFHLHLLGAASGARGLYLDFGSGYYSVKHSSLTKLGTGWTRLCPDGEAETMAAASVNPQFSAYARELGMKKRQAAHALYS